MHYIIALKISSLVDEMKTLKDKIEELSTYCQNKHLSQESDPGIPTSNETAHTSNISLQARLESHCLTRESLDESVMTIDEDVHIDAQDLN